MRVVLPWLVAVVLATAACVSSRSGAQTPTPRAVVTLPILPPSGPSDSFAAEIESICTEASERLVPLLEQLEAGSDAAGYQRQAATLDQLAEEVREVLRRFAELQPPPEDEQAFGSRQDRTKEVRDALRAQAVALYARDVAGARAVAREHGILDLGPDDLHDLLPMCSPDGAA